MITATARLDHVLAGLGTRAEATGGHALRYGLVLILLWIGGMKFTAYEAEGIRPFVENSPPFAWTYPVFGVQGLSDILGVTEILVGLLIAARPWFPRVSAAGSLLAVGMFLGTLSFLVTTPGAWVDTLGGFPVISVLGQFLVKDVALLAIGFKLGVPFLPEAYRNKLVEPDGQYRLYRVIANPDLPDMGFLGFNSSFCTVLCAEMAANWLVRYSDGQLANQPTAAEMQKNIDMMLHFKRVERPAAGVYGGLCVAPYHFKHFDELLADMGATIRRRGALAEKFTPPDADAYARFLASAPDYKVAAA